MNQAILTPALILILWSLAMMVWMYVTRIPAMRKARINAAKMKEKSEMDVLPRSVRQIADNYNHLHEQPTIFYALIVYSHLAGVSDPLNIGLAWGYVGLRIAHSILQNTANIVAVRFTLFSLATLTLMVIAVRNLLALG